MAFETCKLRRNILYWKRKRSHKINLPENKEKKTNKKKTKSSNYKAEVTFPPYFFFNRQHESVFT